MNRQVPPTQPGTASTGAGQAPGGECQLATSAEYCAKVAGEPRAKSVVEDGVALPGSIDELQPVAARASDAAVARPSAKVT